VCSPPSPHALLLQEEVPYEHGVDAEGVRASHGVERGVDQRLAEETVRGYLETLAAEDYFGDRLRNPQTAGFSQ
jgi:hypothetical protein